MKLRLQLTRFLVVGVLAVMTAGISQAGGANWCPCDGGPTPSNGAAVYLFAVVQAVVSAVAAAL